jgi:hypothetical protein
VSKATEEGRLAKAGDRIVDALSLPVDEDGLVKTIWGVKTKKGLAAMLASILAEEGVLHADQ